MGVCQNVTVCGGRMLVGCVSMCNICAFMCVRGSEGLL